MGGETVVWGDAGYQGVHKREENLGLDVEWRVAMRPGKREDLTPRVRRQWWGSERHRLARGMNVSVSEEANRQVPEAKLCDLEVVTTAGQRHAAQVAYHKGHYKNPLTETEVEDRFRSLASGNLPGDRIDALLAHLWRIDEAADLGEMFGLLRFGG